MKKLLMALGLVVLSQPAFAALTISASTYRVDLNMRLYEVCGVVKASAGEAVNGLAIDMQVDSGKNEGHYTTTTNAKGNFCQIVRIVGTQFSISVSGTTDSDTKSPTFINVP